MKPLALMIFLFLIQPGYGQIVLNADGPGGTYALITPMLNAPPIFVMIVSQSFNAVILPTSVLCIFYLGNRKELMAEHRNNLATNIVLFLILLFSIFTSVVGIKGVWQLIDF